MRLRNWPAQMIVVLSVISLYLATHSTTHLCPCSCWLRRRFTILPWRGAGPLLETRHHAGVFVGLIAGVATAAF